MPNIQILGSKQNTKLTPSAVVLLVVVLVVAVGGGGDEGGIFLSQLRNGCKILFTFINMHWSGMQGLVTDKEAMMDLAILIRQ